MDHQSIILDEFLFEYLQVHLDQQVYLQPSLNDPVQTSLPQKSFSKILFENLNKQENGNFLRNPELMELQNGRTLLTLDGKFVEDYSLRSDLEYVRAAKMIVF